MAVFLSDMGCKSHERIITMAHFISHQISLLCNYCFPLSQWQNWWVEYLEKYVSISQRGKHLRGTPQWMRIWRMLIKQCHDLLSVTKHLLFQSQRLGFLENVSFGHSSANFFTLGKSRQFYMACVRGPWYIYLNKNYETVASRYAFALSLLITFLHVKKQFKVRQLISNHSELDQY